MQNYNINKICSSNSLNLNFTTNKNKILIIKEFNKAFELVPSIKLLPLIQIKIQNAVNKIEKYLLSIK